MKIQSSLPSNKLFTSSKNEFIGCLSRTRLVWVILHFYVNRLYGNGPTAGNGCNIKYITRNLIYNIVLVGSLKKQKVCIIFPFSIFFFLPSFKCPKTQYASVFIMLHFLMTWKHFLKSGYGTNIFFFVL